LDVEVLSINRIGFNRATVRLRKRTVLEYSIRSDRLEN